MPLYVSLLVYLWCSSAVYGHGHPCSTPLCKKEIYRWHQSALSRKHLLNYHTVPYYYFCFPLCTFRFCCRRVRFVLCVVIIVSFVLSSCLPLCCHNLLLCVVIIFYVVLSSCSPSCCHLRCLKSCRGPYLLMSWSIIVVNVMTMIILVVMIHNFYSASVQCHI